MRWGRRPTTSTRAVHDLTKGRGADACIDAVGTERKRQPAPVDRTADQSLSQYLRETYAPGPRLLTRERTQLLPELAERFDVRRVRRGNAEPITPASTEKQARGYHASEAQTRVPPAGRNADPEGNFMMRCCKAASSSMIALKHFWPWCGAKRGASLTIKSRVTTFAGRNSAKRGLRPFGASYWAMVRATMKC